MTGQVTLKFPDGIRELKSDRLPVVESTGVVIQSCQCEDIFQDFLYFGFAMTNLYTQWIWHLHSWIRAEVRCSPLCPKVSICARGSHTSLREYSGCGRTNAAGLDLAMVHVGNAKNVFGDFKQVIMMGEEKNLSDFR